MQEHRTIAASYVKSMLRIAAQRGLDSETLLLESGIDSGCVQRDEPVPVQQYGKLYQSIASQLSQEWFGMLSGDAVPRGAIRYLCLLAVHCKTLEAAVQRCTGFFELCRGFMIKQVLERGEHDSVFRFARLSSVSEQDFQTLLSETPPDVIKATLAVMHGFAVWLIGRDIPVKAMHYTFSAPPDERVLERRYPVVYDSDFCGYIIDNEYLDSPIVQTEDGIQAFTDQAPYFVFVRDHITDESLSDRVKTLLLKHHDEAAPTAEQMAAKLNLSVTSLHRKLNGESASYQRLKDESRLELTLSYLRRPKMSTAEMAAELGFDSPSALYRSFKKWTGMTLKEYRNSLQ